jgi:hypothetical protein
MRSRVHILMEAGVACDKWIDVEAPDPPSLATPVWWDCDELREMYYAEPDASCSDLREHHWRQVSHLYV